MGPEGILLRGLEISKSPDALDDGLGHNAVLLIIGVLDGAAAFLSSMAARMEGVISSAYMMTRPSAFRAARPMVWIRGLGPEEALLVRVQNGHQADLWQVQPSRGG